MELVLAGLLWTTAVAQAWPMVIIGVFIAGSGLIEVIFAKNPSGSRVPRTR